MNRSRSFTLAAAFAALMLIVAVAAEAQVAWNPPCAQTNIRNLSPCPVRLVLNTTPMGAIPPINIPAGGVIGIATPPAGLVINSVGSLGGIMYPVLPPPPGAPCNCGIGDFSVCCVTLPPAPGCCFDVCFDRATCTITLRPAACAVCRP